MANPDIRVPNRLEILIDLLLFTLLSHSILEYLLTSIIMLIKRIKLKKYMLSRTRPSVASARQRIAPVSAECAREQASVRANG